jgi:hypothetical protein
MDITRNASAPISTNHTASTSPLPDIIGLGGAVSGLAGGLAMAVVAALISLSIDGNIWLESKQIAAVVFGPAVTETPDFVAGPVIVGSLIHILVSVILGALYGILSRRVFKLPSDFGTPVLTGLIYGMVVWMIAYFVALPLMNPTLLETYAPAFIIQNIVYGVATGLVYTVLRPHPYTESDDDHFLNVSMDSDRRRMYSNGTD